MASQAPKTTPGPTENALAIAVARLGIVTGEQGEVSEWVDVHFNPAALQLQVSNELKDTTVNNERKQYVAKASAKLSMDLQFDTTHNGDDVMVTTKRLQAFVAPPLPKNERDRQTVPPPVVMFEWGRVKFQGIVESYKETIDYFSADGVPLRASVTLTLSQQEQVFDRPGAPEPPNPAADTRRRDTPPGSPAAVAGAAGAPDAARGLAAANGEENLRFGSGASLSVGGSITLNPPAAFAAAGAGIGAAAGAGIGVGIGAGIGIGASAGVTTGGGGAVSTGASAGISGLSRLSAADGAFGGLRATPSGPSTRRLDPSRLESRLRSAARSTDRNASFSVGGKATLDGPAGLRADVGAGPALRGRITFE